MQLLKLLLVALVGGGNAWRSVVHARRVAASTSALSQTTGADDDPPSFPIQSVRSAARMGDADTLRQLVQGWSNHPGLNNRVGDIMGLTPLHWSVAAGQAKGRRACVEALLQAGCDVDAVNNSGNTALMYACATGKIECVEALLAGGAQVGRTGLYGQRPLHSAAARGDASIVELLLNGGAAIDAVDDNGDTALHLARRFGKTAAADALVGRGASTGLQNKVGQTPLEVEKAAITNESYE